METIILTRTLKYYTSQQALSPKVFWMHIKSSTQLFYLLQKGNIMGSPDQSTWYNYRAAAEEIVEDVKYFIIEILNEG